MSDIKKIRVGGVDYNISPDSISEVLTKEYYYNDGSNEVVPIKHPDLSTQPSILPYKFMGQYVYEQLIPITQEALNHFPKLFVDNPIFLKFNIIGDSFISSYAMGGPVREGSIVYLSEKEIQCGKFIHVVYTSMPEENIGYYYNDYYNEDFELSTSGSSNGYEYVDLGLPSGLKWAKCNIGASTAMDNGLYFAWGEKVGYSESDVINGIRTFSLEDYKLNGDDAGGCDGSTYIKYNNIDNLTTLESKDDAASVNMGGSWRMPSKEEYEELLNNTAYAWNTINGVNGVLFRGNNGNTLFLPAGGYCTYEKIGTDICEYWSSSIYPDLRGLSCILYGSSTVCEMVYDNRAYGRPVRGVLD